MWQAPTTKLAELLNRQVFDWLNADARYARFLLEVSHLDPGRKMAACYQFARRTLDNPHLRTGLETVSVEVLDKSCILYRAMPNARRDPISYARESTTGKGGTWWFGEELFDATVRECRGSGLDYRLCLAEKLHYRLAVCRDWSGLGAIWAMRVPRGAHFPVLRGIGRPMPEVSSKLTALYKRTKGAMLAGGKEQLWLPWQPSLSATLEIELP